jgi:hypothetical protein
MAGGLSSKEADNALIYSQLRNSCEHENGSLGFAPLTPTYIS